MVSSFFFASVVHVVVQVVVQVVQVGMMGSGDRATGSLNPTKFHHHTHMISNQSHHTHMIQPPYPYDPTIIPIWSNHLTHMVQPSYPYDPTIIPIWSNHHLENCGFTCINVQMWSHHHTHMVPPSYPYDPTIIWSSRHHHMIQPSSSYDPAITIIWSSHHHHHMIQPSSSYDRTIIIIIIWSTRHTHMIHPSYTYDRTIIIIIWLIFGAKFRGRVIFIFNFHLNKWQPILYIRIWWSKARKLPISMKDLKKMGRPRYCHVHWRRKQRTSKAESEIILLFKLWKRTRKKTIIILCKKEYCFKWYYFLTFFFELPFKQLAN